MGQDELQANIVSVSYESVDVTPSDEFILEGSKGGEEKPHQPVETPNNLLSIAYAKVLLAVGEGELAGTPTGSDIYLNGTPLIGPNGESNFGGVTFEWRSGTQDQTYIQGMPEVSNEISINFDLKQETPWVRQITKTNLSAARITVAIPALYQQKQNGDTVGYSVSYNIEVSTDGGPYQLYEAVTITGKTNTTYERTHRVNLPKDPTSGWSIRVVRTSANSESSLIQDSTTIKSFTEVVDAKQSYPNTALLFLQFDSKLFGNGNIPRISVRVKGRVIRVPDNYDPEARTYSGVWTGAFKWAWTDNPAWVFFDLVTNSRFGLGNRININQVSKWDLYEIAQYCDVMVDDGTGAGTVEPRHTCNVYIQQVADAWTVLRDICSIFNGMTYWDGSQFVAVADKPEPVENIPTFSRSNIVGSFDYPSTDERSIYTSALISYDEPTDHYSTQVEASWERSEILRWKGDRQATINAIGCTSRGEAQRKGKYTLLTNMLNRTVVFRTGLQGLDKSVHPGNIIGVADPLIAGKPFTGRLVSGTTLVVTLDRDTEAKNGDKLYIAQKGGGQIGRTINAVSGRVITVNTPYPEVPQKDAVWYLEASDLKSQLFKVTKITQPEESVYEISAVEYNESKFNAVDNGARLEPRPISKTPPAFITPPNPITVTAETFIEQTMAVTTMTASWDRVENALLYEGQFRVGQGDWIELGTTGANEFNVKGIYTGEYVVRVRSINALGVKSIWGMSATTSLTGKTGAPPTVAFLQTAPEFFGIELTWGFKENSEDTSRIEIMYSETSSFEQAIKLGDFAYPQSSHMMNGLTAGKIFYFWCRLIDRTGNIGAWYPSETGIGIQGQSKINDNGQYNEYFAELISATALDKTLYDRIELIDGPASLAGSVNQRLDDAVADLEEQIGNITDALVYDPTKTYITGEIVRLGNKLYQAQENVPIETPPPNLVYWKDVGTILEEANALAARVDVVEVDIAEIDGRLTSTVRSIESIQAAYREDDGVADQEDAINGWNTKASIATEREVRASANEAFAKELVVYKAEIDGNSASITDLTQVVANNESATATRLESIQVQVDDNAAGLTSEQTARADADSALSTRIDTVTASTAGNTAAISAETTARTNADNALSTRIDTVTATAGSNSAAIQTVSTAQATTDGKVNTAWTLKMEVNSQGQYVAAGIGLGIENGPAGLQSQFLVRADRFAVVNGLNTTTSAPFVVSGGQVFISQALIGTGWITNAMIGNVIQSNNFVAGSSGWQINKAGTFEMNGSNANGRMILTGTYLRFYHSNGVLGIDLSL
jgi:predicted phage tail protein